MQQQPSSSVDNDSQLSAGTLAGTAPILRLILLITLSCSPAATQVSRLNVTGAWEGNFWGGSDFNLTQDGDRVVGKFTYGNGDGFVRGTWADGRLILILTPMTAEIGGTCDARKVLAIPAKGTATVLEPYALDLGNNVVLNGKMTRKSPSAGPVVEYPFEAELKNCGQLMTYDLTFDTNSDKLKGTDWPILRVLADLMTKDPTLKILIAGHTDSTGNAASNLTLSENRANTVVQALKERFHVDAARLAGKGYGAEQPLADNGTEQGRAINRRVELVKQ